MSTAAKKTAADLRAKLNSVKEQAAKKEEVKEPKEEVEEKVEEKEEPKPKTKRTASAKSKATAATTSSAPAPKEEPAPVEEGDALTMDGIIAALTDASKLKESQWKTIRAKLTDNAALHSAADKLAQLIKRVSLIRAGSNVIKKLDDGVAKLLLKYLLGPSYTATKTGKSVNVEANDDKLNEVLTSLAAGYTTPEHISLVIKLIPKTNPKVKTVELTGGLPNSKALVLDGDWATVLDPFVKALNKKRKKAEDSDDCVVLSKIKPRDLALVIEGAMTAISDEDQAPVFEQHSEQVDAELELLKTAAKHHEKK